MRAVRLWMAAYQTGAVAPKTRPSGTAEADRVALTPAGAEYLASLPSAPADTDGSRAYLAKLRTEQVTHEAALRARGYEASDDGVFHQRAEWIAGLEARHILQSRNAIPKPRRTIAELIATE